MLALRLVTRRTELAAQRKEIYEELHRETRPSDDRKSTGKVGHLKLSVFRDDRSWRSGVELIAEADLHAILDEMGIYRRAEGVAVEPWEGIDQDAVASFRNRYSDIPPGPTNCL